MERATKLFSGLWTRFLGRGDEQVCCDGRAQGQPVLLLGDTDTASSSAEARLGVIAWLPDKNLDTNSDSGPPLQETWILLQDGELTDVKPNVEVCMTLLASCLVCMLNIDGTCLLQGCKWREWKQTNCLKQTKHQLTCCPIYWP